ncbi:FAD-dependent oxidoreductase, partial [Rhizobium leguminosarum]
GRMLFEPNLKANLDGADRVYSVINALIDRHISEKGIDAPAASPYAPIWEPEAEIAELYLKAEGITSVIWATGFSPDWSFFVMPSCSTV